MWHYRYIITVERLSCISAFCEHL